MIICGVTICFDSQTRQGRICLLFPSFGTFSPYRARITSKPVGSILAWESQNKSPVYVEFLVTHGSKERHG
jgi:hypothetical protein